MQWQIHPYVELCKSNVQHLRRALCIEAKSDTGATSYMKHQLEARPAVLGLLLCSRVCSSSRAAAEFKLGQTFPLLLLLPLLQFREWAAGWFGSLPPL